MGEDVLNDDTENEEEILENDEYVLAQVVDEVPGFGRKGGRSEAKKNIREVGKEVLGGEEV